MHKTIFFWIILSVLLFLVLSILGFLLSKQQIESPHADTITLDMSLKTVAQKLNITTKFLTTELEIKETINKDKKISDYGINQEKISSAIKHILSPKPAIFKQFIMIGICVFEALFLIFWSKNKIENKYQRFPYHIMLIITIVASFYLGKSPSPMKGIVKLFKAYADLYPDVAAKTIGLVISLILFVIFVNKVICGWACPFGALQDLLKSTPGIGKK